MYEFGENENIEYKEDIPENNSRYLNTVVAFANGKGGKIVFGVRDKTWEITGFNKDEVFDKMDKITNAIFDGCEPKIIPDIKILDVDGKNIIEVNILPSREKPYYIKSEGMLNGVYVRVAGTTRHTERYRVKELIMDGTNKSYDQEMSEEIVSKDDIEKFCKNVYEYTLSQCKDDEMKKKVRKIGINQLLSWKLLYEENGVYHPSNGYLLLEGRNDIFDNAIIQCAVFKGNDRVNFITHKDVVGTLYNQIEEVYAFVLEHINMSSKIEGLIRHDKYELPIEAIREMIINAVCHRSYLNTSHIQVAIYDDRLEVTTPIVLDADLTLEQLKVGYSKVKNKGIATMFNYMGLIEKWGSGIPKIFASMKGYGLKEPELIIMDSAFRINLYRQKDGSKSGSKVGNNNSSESGNKDLGKENEIIKAIKEQSNITLYELNEKTQIPLRTISRILSKLQKEGKLTRQGSKRAGWWEIKQNIVF